MSGEILSIIIHKRLAATSQNATMMFCFHLHQVPAYCEIDSYWYDKLSIRNYQLTSVSTTGYYHFHLYCKIKKKFVILLSSGLTIVIRFRRYIRTELLSFRTRLKK